MKIGIKYCGGCNPDYDRDKIVSEVKKYLPDDISYIRADSENVDAVLVLHGCQRACTSRSSFIGKATYEISKIDDVSGAKKSIEMVKKQEASLK